MMTIFDRYTQNNNLDIQDKLNYDRFSKLRDVLILSLLERVNYWHREQRCHDIRFFIVKELIEELSDEAKKEYLKSCKD